MQKEILICCEGVSHALVEVEDNIKITWVFEDGRKEIQTKEFDELFSER